METLGRNLSVVLLVFFVWFLCWFAVSYKMIFPFGYDKDISEKIDDIERNIDTTLSQEEYENWTATRKTEYADDAFEKMIDWGIQRQLNWGVIIFTVVTLFSRVLFEIRHVSESAHDNMCLYLSLLSIAELVILSIGSVSIHMLVYYYKQVEHLEKMLLTAPPISPISYFVSNWMWPTTIIIFLVIGGCFLIELIRLRN